MSCVWMLQRGHSGDGCVLASTLCKYDLRKGDLFVLRWARVRRVRRGSLSSELLVCGGGVRRDDVCRVCGCYRGGIVVMDVFWRQLCVSMI